MGAKSQKLADLTRVPTGAQLRAARALLNISVSELAERTSLAINTIRRAEGTNGVAPITAANTNLLVGFFERAGVVFIPAWGELGPGVRMSTPTEGSPQKRRRTVSP